MSARVLALITASAMCSTALAGGFICGPAIIDPGNIAQTIAVGMEQARAIAQTADQIATQAKQLEIQKNQQHAGSTSAKIRQLNAADVQSVGRYRDAVQKLYGSSSELRANFAQRQRAASQSGLSWDKYIEREQVRINKNADDAVESAAEQRRLLERVQRDYEYAREMEARIPESAGIHESAQNMNRVFNRLITQQAQLATLLAPMSKAQGQVVDSVMQRVERQSVEKAHRDVLQNSQDALQRSEQRALQMLDQVK